MKHHSVKSHFCVCEMATILSRPQCVNIVNTQYIKWFYRALICYGSIIVKDLSARKVTQKGIVWLQWCQITAKCEPMMTSSNGNIPCYWAFVRGIHRSPVSSPHKDQWRGTWVFPLICAWINAWVNNREAGDLRRHCAHYDVIVMHVRIFLDVWPIQRLIYPCSVEVEMILVITRIIIDM